jgi:glycosyltransferase involved in cell wall biosynthesis
MNAEAIPHVSVLIDTYNHERFIERAITSVLEQDMPMDGVEILVVDDGSIDRTPDLVRRFVPRVHYLRKPNGGQASAFNFGFAQARGDIVATLDGDDWWAREKLRRVLETLEANPDVGIVGHGLYEEYSDGRSNGLILPGSFYRLGIHSRKDADLFRSVAAFFGTSRMTIRKSVLDKILPVPEELTIEADEYIFTLAPVIGSAIILNEPLCYYGIHSGNLFLFDKFEPVMLRRKLNVLQVLLRELPAKLKEFGATEEIVKALVHRTEVDSGRLRLSLDGGSRLEAFTIERAAFRIAYRQVTWRYRLFRVFVLMQTLLMPPHIFYRMRRWYTEKGLYRLRSWTGEPVPAVQIVERRPG